MLRGGDHRVFPSTVAEKMKGLEVLFVDGDFRPSWVMAPGTIYCEMTFSRVAVSGGFNIDLERWEDIRTPSQAVVNVVEQSPMGVEVNSRDMLLQVDRSIGTRQQLLEEAGAPDQEGLEGWLTAFDPFLQAVMWRRGVPSSRSLSKREQELKRYKSK